MALEGVTDRYYGPTSTWKDAWERREEGTYRGMDIGWDRHTDSITNFFEIDE